MQHDNPHHELLLALELLLLATVIVAFFYPLVWLMVFPLAVVIALLWEHDRKG